MKFSACIELLFSELPFSERINSAKEYGFDGIEFWNWKKRDIESIKKKCKKNNIEVALINGLAPNSTTQIIDPANKKKCIVDLKKSIETAARLSCRCITVLSNNIDENGKCVPLSGISEDDKRDNIISILKTIAPIADNENITILLESLNSNIDFPGYYLSHIDNAFKIVKDVNHNNIRILFDIYHIQIADGNIISRLEKNIDIISYIHVADVPDRNEPGTGELNYINIYKKIIELAYNGYIGFEYYPLKCTEDSISSIKEIFKF